MKRIITFAIIFSLFLASCNTGKQETKEKEVHPLDNFLIKKEELNLSFKYPEPKRKLSYINYKGDYQHWKNEVFEKFREVIAYQPHGKTKVTELRSTKYEGLIYHALVMEVSPQLIIPAYLLIPDGDLKGAVMSIHGHGSVEPTIGLYDDYHHKYAYELAKAGYMVLCPELRGFSTLGDLANNIELDNLDYWVSHGRQFTLVTEGFQHGKTVIGETIADLVAWENWWVQKYNIKNFDVAGISYGGDLVLYYPVFSKRVNKIFCSGSLGSFDGIFATCYNAPAHCIPGILEWMDRSDIAGLNAPRPIMLHYGELDTPGPDNHSASYNNSVEPAVEELKEIYANEEAEEKVYLRVTPGAQHEMDNELLISFLNTK